MTITLQFRWASWSKDPTDWETPAHIAAIAAMQALRPGEELQIRTHSRKELTTSEITLTRNEAPTTTTEYEAIGNFHIEWDNIYDLACTFANDFERDDLTENDDFLDWLKANVPTCSEMGDEGTTYHFQRKANSLEDIIQAIDAEEDAALDSDEKAWDDLRNNVAAWAAEHPPAVAA